MTPAELSEILGLPVVVGEPTLVETFLRLEKPEFENEKTEARV